jgi:hypothetical protein
MSSITKLSFSVPDEVTRPSDYADLGSLLLSTFSTPAHLIPSSPIRLQDIEFEEPLESSNLGDDSEEERSQHNEDSQRESLENDSQLSSARLRRREGARVA